MNLLRTLLCLGVALLPSVLLAQTVEFPVTFKNVTPVQTRTFPFTIAAHPQASDTIDPQFGEVEIPNLGFPGDVFYVWSLPPLDEVLWFSPKDIRELRAGQQFREDYRIEVNWTGGSLEVAVMSPLPSTYIDSVVIVDDYTDYPDNILRYKVGVDEPIKTTNVAIRKFRVIVFYNALAVSVAEEHMSPLTVYPNPTTDQITLIGLEGASELRIASGTGEVIRTLPVDGERVSVDCAGLPAGTYYVTTESVSGRMLRTMFVKY